jgi:hypothetical protein
LRAERRLGEMMRAQKETFGLNTGTRGQLVGPRIIGTVPETAPMPPPTLKDAGIDENLAKRARKLERK